MTILSLYHTLENVDALTRVHVFKPQNEFAYYSDDFDHVDYTFKTLGDVIVPEFANLRVARFFIKEFDRDGMANAVSILLAE